MSHVLGIDLGTVNSCVAVVREGKPVVLGEGGDRTTPSAVSFQDGRELVGRGARRHAVTDPQNTVIAVKRLLGYSFDSPEVQTARERMAYAVKPSPLGTVLLEAGGKELTPVQVSARVLQRLKEVAEEALGEPVDRAVISVPAHFNDVQRKATKLAAEYAGLQVVRLLNEPTAAAFAYGYRKGEDFTLAVYDLGGGTFDVTVMRAQGDTFEVVATDGDSYLGGEDFDRVIQDWLVEEFRSEFGHDLKTDQAALLRLKEAAEKAKIELTEVAETSIDLPFLTRLPDGSQPQLTRQLGREKLSELARPLTERTLELCRRCLAEANLHVTMLDEVLLVGGQSRMPCVRDAVRRFFGREPRRDINPDEVVAVGAALYGHSVCADELHDEAALRAGGAYEIALKGTEIARKMLDEIQLRRTLSSDEDLRDRLAELLSKASREQEQLPSLRTLAQQLPESQEHLSEPDPEEESTQDEEEEFIVESTRHPEAGARARVASELPPRHRRSGRDLPDSSAFPQRSLQPDRNLPDSGALPEQYSDFQGNLPESIRVLRERLKGMSIEANEALSGLSEEFGDKEAGEQSGDAVVGAVADKLSSLLEGAREASERAQLNAEEAEEHGNARRVELIDVTSHALGVAAAADLFTVLIDHNTPVPAEKRRIFTTNQDGQREVQIRVLEGRGDRASENQLLGDFILEGIEPAPRMEPKIEVAFQIDANGILSVTAHDVRTGVKQGIRIEDPLGLQQTSADQGPAPQT